MFEIKKSRRGFASMSVEKQREIARKGGQSPRAGRPFLDKGLASRAGQKGGGPRCMKKPPAA